MAMMLDVVRLAVRAMVEVELRRKSEKLALSRATSELGIERAEAVRFAHRLVLESLKHLNLLDELANIALAGETSLKELSARARAFLRLFAYRAVVEGADRRELVRFVLAAREALGKGVLRPIERALGRCTSLSIRDALASRSGDERKALELRVPPWLWHALCRDLGRDVAARLLKAFLDQPRPYVRINTLKGDEDAIIASLEGEGVRLKPVEGLRHVYEVLGAGRPLVLTEAYKEGLIYPQDKASCLAVEVASPEPGMEVLDVCAAPGAKTSHMAQLMENEGLIVSLDFSPRRLSTWKNLMAKLNVLIAEPVLADARYPLPVRLKADLVLLDPPCTSTGAFGRAPSAKWRLTPRSAKNMARIQARMLRACAEHVKPGGVLVYVTCSLLVEENELVLERFLRANPEFKLERAEPFLGLPGLRGLSNAQRLYPHLHACDGYFIAKLRKEA